MTRDMSVARHDNIAKATTEGKRVLLKTKTWKTTKEHLDQWIMLTYALGHHTRKDYIDNVYSRLLRDPETKELLEE